MHNLLILAILSNIGNWRYFWLCKRVAKVCAIGETSKPVADWSI